MGFVGIDWDWRAEYADDGIATGTVRAFDQADALSQAVAFALWQFPARRLRHLSVKSRDRNKEVDYVER